MSIQQNKVNMKIFFAECIGTFLLILLGNGSVANVLLKKSKGEGGGWIVIATAWGFAVALSVYICGWVSDAHINPAITIAFALTHKIAYSQIPFYIAGQFLGAFLGALLVYITYYPHYQIEKNLDLIRMTFCTQPAIDKPIFNFIAEVVGTFVLLFAVCGITNIHSGLSCGIAPYLIGIVVFSIGLSLGGPTGYAINPARDLAPRLAHSFLYSFSNSKWNYAWIPLLGPIVGGALGAILYNTIFN